MALEHLHDNGIIMKNLESSGILMTESEEMLDKSIPRIARFNKAEITGYESYVHNIEGDIRFRAPEVLLGKHYDFRADSWSFGIIIF
jgi:serine/threonine protein kinase